MKCKVNEAIDALDLDSGCGLVLVDVRLMVGGSRDKVIDCE
jgi:hypothetical protein